MHGIEHEHIVRLYGVVLDTNALMLVCHSQQDLEKQYRSVSVQMILKKLKNVKQ